MISTTDKAWVAGLATFAAQLLSAKFGLTWITPEMVALVTGALVYWVPNLPEKP